MAMPTRTHLVSVSAAITFASFVLLTGPVAFGQYRVGTDGHYNEHPATRPAPPAAMSIEAATAILSDARVFAGPKVGDAGLKPPQYAAFEVILARPDAADRFDRLTRSARPAARLYGLLGLRQTDAARYARVVHDHDRSDAELETFFGCTYDKATERRVIAAWGPAPATRP